MTTDAINLYLGRTAHRRTQPFEHGFSYSLALFMLDLRRLGEAAQTSRWFSVNRFNLFAFHERDHGARDGSSVLDWALERFAERGIDLDGGDVRLLCAPRVLGYQFNPLSVHLGFGPDGALRGVIYEVHNTFGDAHAYVAPASGAAMERQSADKTFHVSPFFDVAGEYHFNLREPGERFGLIIRKIRKNGADFFANMMLDRKSASDGALLKLFFTQPFSTLKTMAAIHWEALRLVLKGARYHSRPVPPEPAASAARGERGSGQ